MCVSPGSTVCQIVVKGTVLELDRLTQDSKSVRGFRESFLICKDKSKSRELAFRLMSTCKLSKLSDISSYSVKELIERLPLPQTVEFLVSNPYDVVSASDVEAADLLTILSGPLELLSLKIQEYLVGHVIGAETVVGFPWREEVLEQVLVNIPVSPKTGSIRDVYNDAFDSVAYEEVFDKLYLLYADQSSAVVLNNDCSAPVSQYDMMEESDPPPVPHRKPGLQTLYKRLN